MHWYQTKLFAGALGAAVVYWVVLMVGGRGQLTWAVCAGRFAAYVAIGTVLVEYTCQSASPTDHFLMGLMWPSLIFGFVTNAVRRVVVGPHDGNVALADALGMP